MARKEGVLRRLNCALATLFSSWAGWAAARREESTYSRRRHFEKFFASKASGRRGGHLRALCPAKGWAAVPFMRVCR